VQNPKFLFLLLTLVVFINYMNYILPDRDKYINKIQLLERKIAKEQKLNKQHIDVNKLTLPYKSFFFDSKKYNYSQSMGKFQEIITKSVEKHCKIKSIKWAPVPSTLDLYDRLKINLSLECKVKEMYKFINTLRKNNKLFYVQNLKIFPPRKIKKIKINMQLIAYRNHNEK